MDDQIIDRLVPYVAPVVLWTYKLVAIMYYPVGLFSGHTFPLGDVLAAKSVDELPRLQEVEHVYVFEKEPSFIKEWIGLIVCATFIAAWLDFLFRRSQM